MPAKHILSAVVAAALTTGLIGSLHAQEPLAPSASYVYRIGVKGLSAPPPACVEGVVPQTQTASCPAGQTVGGEVDGLSTFTQSYQVTTACPSGEYGAPVVTPGDASPTVAATCSEPDPWTAFFKGLGVAVPNPWSAGFKLPSRGISTLPAEPYPAAVVNGEVNLSNNALTSLGGLSSLQSVNSGNGLNLSKNMLANVDALSNLQKVDGMLNLSQNPSLSNVDGLSRLGSVRMLLDLSQNPSLTNVNGLSGLGYVDGALDLSNNENLASLSGLSSLTYLSGLRLNGDPKLTDLSVLGGLSGFAGVNNVYIDAGIHLRPGFVPIPGGILCSTTKAGTFAAGYATQEEVCASVH